MHRLNRLVGFIGWYYRPVYFEKMWRVFFKKKKMIKAQTPLALSFILPLMPGLRCYQLRVERAKIANKPSFQDPRLSRARASYHSSAKTIPTAKSTL
jgi:hypothetical protein